MLTGSQLFTNTAAAIDAAQSAITLNSVAGLTIPTNSHTYFVLDDGVAQEIVKATSMLGSAVFVERGQFGTQARPFVVGVCVKAYNGYETVCELIAQGGCTGVGTTACTPVTSGGSFFPDAVIGAEWQAAAAFANAAAILVPIKPAWATATIQANMVTLVGTPPPGAVDSGVVIIANGCNSSSIITDRRVRICQQIGVVA